MAESLFQAHIFLLKGKTIKIVPRSTHTEKYSGSERNKRERQKETGKEGEGRGKGEGETGEGGTWGRESGVEGREEKRGEIQTRRKGRKAIR